MAHRRRSVDRCDPDAGASRQHSVRYRRMGWARKILPRTVVSMALELTASTRTKPGATPKVGRQEQTSALT